MWVRGSLRTEGGRRCMVTSVAAARVRASPLRSLQLPVPLGWRWRQRKRSQVWAQRLAVEEAPRQLRRSTACSRWRRGRRPLHRLQRLPALLMPPVHLYQLQRRLPSLCLRLRLQYGHRPLARCHLSSRCSRTSLELVQLPLLVVWPAAPRQALRQLLRLQ